METLVFEHDERFYNPRYVKVIGKIRETSMGKFCFTVDFDRESAVPFTFETREDAERERLNLAAAVNKSNGE